MHRRFFCNFVQGQQHLRLENRVEMLRAEGIRESLQNGIAISWRREAVDPDGHNVPDVPQGLPEVRKVPRKEQVKASREWRFRQFKQTAGFLKEPSGL